MLHRTRFSCTHYTCLMNSHENRFRIHRSQRHSYLSSHHLRSRPCFLCTCTQSSRRRSSRCWRHKIYTCHLTHQYTCPTTLDRNKYYLYRRNRRRRYHRTRLCCYLGRFRAQSYLVGTGSTCCRYTACSFLTRSCENRLRMQRNLRRSSSSSNLPQ